MSEVKYLSNDGFCYLSYWYGDNENIVNIFYFDKNSKEVLNFKNNKVFHSYWLDKNLTSNDVLILDGIGTYPKVENMQNNDVKKYLLYIRIISCPLTLMALRLNQSSETCY